MFFLRGGGVAVCLMRMSAKTDEKVVCKRFADIKFVGETVCNVHMPGLIGLESVPGICETCTM
jgi:hypothetical protein